MYGSISVGARSIDEYRPIVGAAVIDEVRELARLGRSAHRTVAGPFLATHYLMRYLKLFQRLLGRKPSASKR
jgi:hypothetical protein